MVKYSGNLLHAYLTGAKPNSKLEIFEENKTRTFKDDITNSRKSLLSSIREKKLLKYSLFFIGGLSIITLLAMPQSVAAIETLKNIGEKTYLEPEKYKKNIKSVVKQKKRHKVFKLGKAKKLFQTTLELTTPTIDLGKLIHHLFTPKTILVKEVTKTVFSKKDLLIGLRGGILGHLVTKWWNKKTQKLSEEQKSFEVLQLIKENPALVSYIGAELVANTNILENVLINSPVIIGKNPSNLKLFTEKLLEFFSRKQLKILFSNVSDFRKPYIYLLLIVILGVIFRQPIFELVKSLKIPNWIKEWLSLKTFSPTIPKVENKNESEVPKEFNEPRNLKPKVEENNLISVDTLIVNEEIKEKELISTDGANRLICSRISDLKNSYNAITRSINTSSNTTKRGKILFKRRTAKLHLIQEELNKISPNIICPAMKVESNGKKENISVGEISPFSKEKNESTGLNLNNPLDKTENQGLINPTEKIVSLPSQNLPIENCLEMQGPRKKEYYEYQKLLQKTEQMEIDQNKLVNSITSSTPISIVKSRKHKLEQIEELLKELRNSELKTICDEMTSTP